MSIGVAILGGGIFAREEHKVGDMHEAVATTLLTALAFIASGGSFKALDIEGRLLSLTQVRQNFGS
jgi:hypothetical protein